MQSLSVSKDAADQARLFLISHTIENIRNGRSQQVVLIKDSASVEQALSELASRRILSAPVVSCIAGDASEPTWPMKMPADDTLGFIGGFYCGCSPQDTG